MSTWIIMAYIANSLIITIIFFASVWIYKKLSKRINNSWFRVEFILAALSLIGVTFLKLMYPEMISIIGSRGVFSGNTTILVFASALPAALLAFMASPELKSVPLRINIATGMVMEIFQRLLVQNVFMVFGATTALYGSLNLAIVMTAIIWVQFIILQQVINKRPFKPHIILDIIASSWFSIGVGILYLYTGNILVVMATHGLERGIVHSFRKMKKL